MRILITGSTGYIGRRVVASLLEVMPEAEIVALCRDVDKADRLCHSKRCINVSVNDMAHFVPQFAPQLVLHLATLSTSSDDTDIIQPIIDTNITFGVRLLDILSTTNSLRLFVNVGSFAEYRNGLNAGQHDAYLYTATKSAFRHFVEYYSAKCGFKHITTVPYTVYGGNDTAKKLMDYMVESATAIEPVKMTAGEQILDFVHVDDIVRFFVNVALAANDELRFQLLADGEEFHLGTGVGTKVRHLADIISDKMGVPLNIEWGGRPYRPLDVMYAVAPIKTNSIFFNWHANITLSQGLNLMLGEGK